MLQRRCTQFADLRRYFGGHHYDHPIGCCGRSAYWDDRPLHDLCGDGYGTSAQGPRKVTPGVRAITTEPDKSRRAG